MEWNKLFPPWFQVVACDVQSVANEILQGVEDALAVKKREYVQTANINLVKFSNEVNIVVRYLLQTVHQIWKHCQVCGADLYSSFEEVVTWRNPPQVKSRPSDQYFQVIFVVFNPRLLILLPRMTGLRELYLGYGSVNPERMDRLVRQGWKNHHRTCFRYYSEAFIKMRFLTHFSLKRNCTDKIIKILSKSSPYSLQVCS